MKESKNIRFAALAAIVLLAALSRLLPHPPNFTPIAAIALFGGAYFTNRKWAFGVPLLAMIVSDICLNMMYGYAASLVVYGCFILITMFGFLLREKVKFLRVAVAALGSSLLFFIITNFAVWAGGNMYPHDVAGLMLCYEMAIPFFRNTLLGDLVYCGLLFGVFELVKQRYPLLAER